jgi:hypothetical protein
MLPNLTVLYNVKIPTINEHIAKIYFDYELEAGSTIRNFRIVQAKRVYDRLVVILKTSICK